MIAYCVACRNVRLPRQCSLLPEGIGCTKCGHYVLVLDGDRVSLSQEISSFDLDDEDQGPLGGARGYIFAQHDQNVDLLECQEMLRLDEYAIDARLYMGKHAFSRFRYADAEHHFKLLVQYYPKFLEAKQLLASVYLIVKKYDLALAVCEDVRKVDEHDVQTFFNLGLACYYSAKHFRALSVFQLIVDRDVDPDLVAQSVSYVNDLKQRIGLD